MKSKVFRALAFGAVLAAAVTPAFATPTGCDPEPGFVHNVALGLIVE